MKKKEDRSKGSERKGIIMRQTALFCFILVCFILSIGCDKLNLPQPNQARGAGRTRSTPVSRNSNTARTGEYQSLHPIRTDWQDFAPGTITHDWYYAASAGSLSEAAKRWQEYLQKHSEVQDGFSKHFYTAAKIELLRVYYLMGLPDRGDAVLREYDLSTLERKQ
ncbi:MAG: hypothetical protein JXA82_13305 [Sedimentisphaerales bacterium]|nr:hypothetical protein [Sedimentisphaerales bacterium]